MTRSTRLLLWISGLGFLLMVLSIVAVLLLMRYEDLPVSGDPVALKIRLEGYIPDGPGSSGLILDERDFPALLTEYTQVIRHAAQDPDVSSLVLDLRPLELGWAGVQELSDALGAFRESGKPCTATSDLLSNKEYMVAAACGEIHLSPAGLFLVNGLSLTQTYYLGTLEKLGVVANLEHVGEYKSAVEPYQRSAPSPEAQEAVNSMLDGIWTDMVQAIASYRGLEPAQVQALVDASHLTPQKALENGLVDALSYRQEVLDDKVGKDALRFDDYLDTVRSLNRASPVVAVLHAEGTIVSADEGDDGMGDGSISDRRLVRALDDLLEDEDVVAVVLRVNSPGGSGLASDNIWRAVERLKEKKPVVVSMSDLAASGGYYISAGAHAIVAEPATLTGSIGVFGGKVNVRGLFEMVGLTLFTYKRGANADLLSWNQDFSEDGRARFREFLQGFYDLFLERVATGRGLTTEQVDALARGRVWTGRQALENGLVDALGGLDVAVEEARKRANVTEETGLRHLPKERTLVEELMMSLEHPGDEDLLVRSLLEPIPGGRQTLRALLDAKRVLGTTGVAAMMPSTIEIR